MTENREEDFPEFDTTKDIGEKAKAHGYNVIRYFSARAPNSINFAILSDFDELLTPQMIVPTP